MTTTKTSRWHLLTGALAISLALAACSGDSRSNTADQAAAQQNQAAKGVSKDINMDQCGKDSRTIKHALGTTSVTGMPSRVVVLEGSFIDALVALGMSPTGIADDNDPKFVLPQLKDKMSAFTSVGTRAQPNLQVITGLKPDLIIADSERHKGIYDALTKIAPTVAFPSLRATYQQILDSHTLISQTVNKCAEMTKAINAHTEVMEGLKKKVPANEARKVLFAVTWDKGFNSHTNGAFTPTVLRVLGLKTIPESDSAAYAELTLETLAAANPDVMFLARTTPKTLEDGWAANPVYASIAAVANKQVFNVDSFVWSKSRGLVSAQLIATEAIKSLYNQ